MDTPGPKGSTMTPLPARQTRVGMTVPSWNTTMEAELAELLRRQQQAGPPRFSLHGARLRQVAGLDGHDAVMDAVDSLCDAQVEAIVHADVAGLMPRGRRGICDMHAQLSQQAAESGRHPSVVTSAGALVSALKALNANRITLIAPYLKASTQLVCKTLGEYGIEAVQSRSLEVVAPALVGRLDQAKLLAIASQLDYSGSQVLVISACVQMPSLDIIDDAEQMLGLPVVSAVTATAFELLNCLDMEPAIHGAGCLLRPRAAARRQPVLS
jgi:maleate isomerase